VNRLRLTFASAVNERTRPLIEGTVQPEGIELVPVVSDPSETFWKMLRTQEFDVSEMSLSSFLIAREQGYDAVAIPAFPSRRFMHVELVAHREAGIEGPEDIAGKRLGVGEYQQTAALWTRGILEHDFGVSQYDVHWFMERTPEQSHGAATGFTPPDGITFSRVPPDRSLASMLLDGDLDVALVKRALRKSPEETFVERSSHSRVTVEDVERATRPVFADPIAEGKRFFATHGFIPVNHTYVIAAEVHRRHPWVAPSIFDAMVQAKALGERTLVRSLPLSLVFGEEYLAMTRAALGPDPFPYGLEPNRHALQTLIDYSHEQRLTATPADLESLFEPTTVARHTDPAV
jgi:4,5-dihydroxyphthalate decarboxylase